VKQRRGCLSLPLRKPVVRRKLVRFLRAHGWSRVRSGRGDHEIWEYTAPDGDASDTQRMVLPFHGARALVGQPFLRQINQAMEGRAIQSRGRRG
jgi:predicted RNA binding protein YcfA (HicA-like mRNA interferase family)